MPSFSSARLTWEPVEVNQPPTVVFVICATHPDESAIESPISSVWMLAGWRSITVADASVDPKVDLVDPKVDGGLPAHCLMWLGYGRLVDK